jgi:hypothetical protein
VAGLAQRLGCACGVVATAVGRSTRQPGCTTSRRTPASVHTGHARTSVRIGGTLQDLHVPIVGWRSKGLSAFTRFTGVEVQRISCVSGAAARQWTRPDGLLGWSVAFGSAMCCASADFGFWLAGVEWDALDRRVIAALGVAKRVQFGDTGRTARVLHCRRYEP